MPHVNRKVAEILDASGYRCKVETQDGVSGLWITDHGRFVIESDGDRCYRWYRTRSALATPATVKDQSEGFLADPFDSDGEEAADALIHLLEEGQ